MLSSLQWKRKVLANGLTVLLFPRASGITTQIAIGLKYGSNADPSDKSGTAHFLEHMIAGGSSQRINLSREIERLGGSVDFFTTHDYTMTITDIVPEKIFKASNIMEQLLFDSCFEKQNFDRERKIILHELAEAYDNPWIQIDEMLTRCLFNIHPVRRPVSGYKKTVQSLKIEDIKNTHSEQYVSNNMILAITGQFTECQVEQMLSNFDSKSKSKTLAINLECTERKNPKKGKSRTRAGLSQAYLSIGARTVSGKHRDIPALELTNIILGGGASSRLFIELREKRALAYNIQSSQECGIDYGYFHIDCAVKIKNLNKTIKLLFQELEKIKNEKVPEEELTKAKDMILGAIYREVDSPTNLPETLASMEMLFGSENALTNYVQNLKEITPNDIAETANKYFQENNSSTVMLTPKP